jgi:surfeit locus 1 family protein
MNERWRRVVVWVAALAGMALTARLGVWQLDRAAQKQALITAIAERGALPPLPAADLATTAPAAETQHQRRVRLQGRFVAAHTVFLDNRQMRERPGFFVLTPLALPDGTAVLVQRGWVPRDPVDPVKVSAPAPPDGDVVLDGRIAPPPSRLYEFDGATSGPIRQNLDLTAFARETGLALRPLSVQQLGDAGDGLLRDWPQGRLDVSKHHGYAVQWFALSLLIAGLTLWFQVIRPRRGAPGDPTDA